MKKKILALCLVVALAVTAIAGATLAYFTDVEKADNTFTIGNVDIELTEKQYNWETKQWEPYDDGGLMFPMSNADGMNQYNKAVQTKNISTSGEPVYIRTLIAVEDPDAGEDVGVYSMHVGFNTANSTTADGHIRYGVDYVKHNDITIDGRNFDVFECTVLDGAKVAVDDYVQSLNSVWMDEDIDATGAAAYGNKVEVYVVSQGIQAAELTHAEAMAELVAVADNALDDLFDIPDAQ